MSLTLCSSVLSIRSLQLKNEACCRAEYETYCRIKDTPFPQSVFRQLKICLLNARYHALRQDLPGRVNKFFFK
ncbi:hypothetical protein DPQ22_05230 [Candidatus Tokpelaia sp.]|nr:hypothetical protein DPQ22_05230 [Candidatus Tokpelaia sp.]